MSAKSFRKIVNNPKHGKEELENTLAILFRDMLFAQSPSLELLDRKMERYYQRIYGGDRRLIAQEKNNLTKALTKPSISWERFETMIQLLGPDKYMFRVEMTYGEKTYVCEVEVPNKYSDRRLKSVEQPSKPRRKPKETPDE